MSEPDKLPRACWLDAPAEVLARIVPRCCDAGHMMYTRQADLAQLKTDLAAWLGRH